MLTKNFYTIIPTHLGLASKVAAPYVTSTGASSTYVSYTYLLNAMQWVKCHEPKEGGYGIYFGTGTTPATLDDYRLESPITDGSLSSSVTATIYKGYDTDHARIYATHEVKNSGSSDITITEAGVFGKTTDSSSNVFLLDRVVLETPITIPAGMSKSITYSIMFLYPTT